MNRVLRGVTHLPLRPALFVLAIAAVAGVLTLLGAEAQWFHENCNPGDEHRLDGDNDGSACESLP